MRSRSRYQACSPTKIASGTANVHPHQVPCPLITALCVDADPGFWRACHQTSVVYAQVKHQRLAAESSQAGCQPGRSQHWVSIIARLAADGHVVRSFDATLARRSEIRGTDTAFVGSVAGAVLPSRHVAHGERPNDDAAQRCSCTACSVTSIAKSGRWCGWCSRLGLEDTSLDDTRDHRASRSAGDTFVNAWPDMSE